jgi:hypothetical protein
MDGEFCEQCNHEEYVAQVAAGAPHTITHSCRHPECDDEALPTSIWCGHHLNEVNQGTNNE